MIELKSVHTVAPVTIKKHSFAFGIVTSKRTFLVKASSPDEMEDWVRAVNGCRRKLSEREEEDRNKREGKVSGIAIPSRQGMSGDGMDVHQGTYSTTYTTGSISSSPIATTGYFAPKMSSTNQTSYSMGGPQTATPTSAAIPASPLDTMNSLTAQMARVAIPRTPSISVNTSRSVSNQRDPSASSVGSSRAAAGEYMPRSAQPMQLSSDEDEPYFSDPVAGLGMSVGTTVSMTPSASGMGLVMDPKKIILSAYLMKRSKGRGRRVWKKRWFFLTSQGLTYTKSHMVRQLFYPFCSNLSREKLMIRTLVHFGISPYHQSLTLSISNQASHPPMPRIPIIPPPLHRPRRPVNSPSSVKAAAQKTVMDIIKSINPIHQTTTHSGS